MVKFVVAIDEPRVRFPAGAQQLVLHTCLVGPMDKVSASEAGDSGFESRAGLRTFQSLVNTSGVVVT